MTKDKTKRRTTDKFVNQGSICASVKKKNHALNMTESKGILVKQYPNLEYPCSVNHFVIFQVISAGSVLMSASFRFMGKTAISLEE